MVARGRPQRLRARGAGDRRRAVDPGPARAARRAAPGGRRAARPLRRPTARTSSPSSTCGTTSREQRGSCPQPVPPAVPRRVPQLPARPRVAGPARQLRQVARTAGLHPERAPTPPRDRIHVAVLAGLLSPRRPARRPRDARVPRRPRRPVRDLPGLGAGQEAAALGDGRRAGRDLPAVGPHRRPDRARVGRAAGRAPRQAHLRRAALVAQARGRASPPSGSRCTACRSSPTARVDYGRIDPELSRELFIRHALVEGDWDTHHAFFHANRELLDDVEELEHRARRRDLVVDDETLFAFYDARIPADVVSGRHFDTWWKKHPRRQPDLLDFTAEMLLTAAGGDAIDRTAYPDHVEAGGLTLPLSYEFEPGTRRRRRHRPRAARRAAPGRPDAVRLAGARPARGAGHRADPVAAQDPAPALRARRPTTPAPCWPRLQGRRRAAARRRWSASWAGCAACTIPREAWELDRLPDHLTVTFRVVDEQRPRAGPRQGPGGAAPASSPRRCAPSWPAAGDGPGAHRADHLDDRRRCPASTGSARGGHVVTGYPALVDEGDTVAVRVVPDRGRARPAMWRGVRRLLLLDTPSPARQVQRGLDNAAKLALCPATRTARSPRCSTTASTAAADALHRRGRRAGLGRARLRPAARRVFAPSWPARRPQVLAAVRARAGGLAPGAGPAARPDRSAPLRAGADITRPAGRAWSAPASSPRPARPGWPTWPATWRRSSGGWRSCASTRSATPAWTAQVRESWPTSTPSCWPQLPPGTEPSPALRRDPLDDRGAAGQPLRAPDADPLPGLGQAHPAGHRRAVVSDSPYRKRGLAVPKTGTRPLGVGQGMTWILRPCPPGTAPAPPGSRPAAAGR